MNNQPPKKGVLILIIVLLVIFTPLTIFSFVLHLMKGSEEANTAVENEGHEFAYQGKLYFYSKDDRLLGTYACEHPGEYCNYAVSSLDNQDYALDSYVSDDFTTSLIQDRYVFLIDGTNEKDSTPFLYDLSSERVLMRYMLVKDYGIGIENNCFIVKSTSSKYGVINLSGDIAMPIPLEYDFLGLANLVDEEEQKIIGDIYAGLKNNMWYLIGENGAVLTEPISREIVTYNGQYIITKDEDGYHLINYKNEELLEEEAYTSLSFTGKYLNVLDNYNDFYVYDIAASKKISTPIHVKNTDIVTSRINDNGKLEVLQNGNLIESVAIS